MDQSIEAPPARPPGPLYALASRAPAAVRRPLQVALDRAASLSVAWPVAAAVGLAAAVLVVTWRLGALELPVAASFVAETLVVVLLVVATWDLLVRWGRLRDLPLLTGPAPEQRARRLLRHVGPTVFLLAGIALGRLFWS